MPKRARTEIVNTDDKLDQIMTNAVYTTNASDDLTVQIQTLTDRWQRLDAGGCRSGIYGRRQHYGCRVIR